MSLIGSARLQKSVQIAVEHTNPAEGLVLYSRSNCFACMRTKQFLKETGTFFVEKNLTTMDEGDEISLLLRSNVIAPTLVLGGQAVTGFYEDQIAALLQET